MAGRVRFQQAGDPAGLPPHFVAPVPPGVGHGLQHLVEARHARPAGAGQPLARRPVRPAEERFALGREEDRQRPAAVAGHGLHRFHVNLVQLGPLLAVDLDADELFVEQPGNLGVFEAFAGHHVAPMAGRVADRQKDRLLLGPSQRDRLLAPGLPVDRIVGVLEQVGTQFVAKLVRHGNDILRWQRPGGTP